LGVFGFRTIWPGPKNAGSGVKAAFMKSSQHHFHGA